MIEDVRRGERVVRPGETRELAATWAPKDLGAATPVVAVDGWNIPATTAN